MIRSQQEITLFHCFSQLIVFGMLKILTINFHFFSDSLLISAQALASPRRSSSTNPMAINHFEQMRQNCTKSQQEIRYKYMVKQNVINRELEVPKCKNHGQPQTQPKRKITPNNNNVTHPKLIFNYSLNITSIPVIFYNLTPKSNFLPNNIQRS